MHLPTIVHGQIDPPRALDIDVFAYSNEAMLPEQIASVRSFLKYEGRHNNFTIVSDGTHRPHFVWLLQELDSCIRVTRARDFLPEQSSSADYSANHPTVKQLALILS